MSPARPEPSPGPPGSAAGPPWAAAQAAPPLDLEQAAQAAALLGGLRASIDNIDAALVHLLAERFKFTQTVGHLKAEAGLPPADLAREAQQIARLRALAVESGLDPVFAEKFVNFIVAEVIRHHEAIADSRPAGA
ncbi:MAG: chorismate mutase [Bifidobacteriaceae bacterium]|nr:chorismate mutase [Bifidobacteriaceae bacterium]